MREFREWNLAYGACGIGARRRTVNWPHDSRPEARPTQSFRAICAVAFAAAFAATLLRTCPLAAQTNGVWNVTTSGSATGTNLWSNASNWQSGQIADGRDAIADFSQLVLAGNETVHFDASGRVGNLIFGDLGNTYNWTIDGDNLPTRLDLGVSTGRPTIIVNNGSATISTIVTGTSGFVLNPNGETGTLILTGANTIYERIPDSYGGYGAITVDGGLLSISSDVAPGTTTIATASPLGYLPPGNAPSVGTGAIAAPANIVLNGGGLQATATFSLNSHRGIAIGSPAGGGGGTIDVTDGHTLIYGVDQTLDGAGGQPISGVISDYNIGSSLTLTGGGTLFLTGSNTYTGATNITGAGFTLLTGTANAISRFSSLSLATGSTFLLNGFSQAVGSLAGAGTVTNDSSANVTVTIGSDNTSPNFAGILSNSRTSSVGIITSLIKVGAGNQTLSTSNGATWAATGNGGGYDLAGPASGTPPVIALNGGALILDLSHATTQTNLINPFYAVQLGGGALALIEPANSGGTSQSFNGATITCGGSAVVVTTNGNGSSTGFTLGSITRAPSASPNFGLGTVDFTPGSVSTGSITTTAPNSAGSILGGWATFGGGASWAVSAANGTLAGNISALSNYTDDVWATGNNTNVTQSGAPVSGSTTNSLRFNTPGASGGAVALTLAGTNTVGSGGILVAPNVGTGGAAITGNGVLTSGNGADLIIQQFDTAGPLTISAPITGTIGLTKSGPGTLIIAGVNSYTGVTTINQGIVSISASGTTLGGPLGAGAAQGATNVVIDGGTLQATSLTTTTISFGTGISLGPTSGYGNGTIDVTSEVTFIFVDDMYNNGTSDSSLTKTGPGTLFLTGVDVFTGGINIGGGTIVINRDNTLNSINPITFSSNATLQISSYVWSSTVHPLTISSGANATIDNNAGAGGLGAIDIIPPVHGVGGFTYMSSFGSTSPLNRLSATSSPSGNWTYTGANYILFRQRGDGTANGERCSLLHGIQPQQRAEPWRNDPGQWRRRYQCSSGRDFSELRSSN